MNEELSVIIPVYNRSGLVEATLDSVKGQTYRPIHLIVVDNNSTDSTNKVLVKWKRDNEESGFRVTVLEEETPGACAARNRGVEATGDGPIIFFDSDDLMHSDLADTGMKALADNPDADMVYWRHERILLDGSRRVSHFTTGDLMECHLVHALFATHSYVVRKEFFLKSGGWNEQLMRWNDFELGVRLLRNNPKTVGVDRILYTLRCQKESITGTDFNSKAGEWERVLDIIESELSAYRVTAENGGNKLNAAERYKRIVDYRRVILAAHYAREGCCHLAKPIMLQVMGKDSLTIFQKYILRFAYIYTSRGGRGIWRLIHSFI